MNMLFRNWRILLALLALLLAAGCATQLAPAYDKAIVDGLRSSNREAMILFATLAAESESKSYPARAATYNQLIGTLDALEMQSRARPMPKGAGHEAANKLLEKRGLPVVGDDEAPSATALNRMSAILSKMRDTDRKQGLSPTEVQAFKGQMSIYMDQAMTYEAFLQR